MGSLDGIFDFQKEVGYPLASVLSKLRGLRARCKSQVKEKPEQPNLDSSGCCTIAHETESGDWRHRTLQDAARVDAGARSFVNLFPPGLSGFAAPRTHPVQPGTRFVRLYGCMDEILSQNSKRSRQSATLPRSHARPPRSGASRSKLTTKYKNTKIQTAEDR